jgi:Zn-dependent peptidase ImmA (M78 family)
MGDTSRFAVKMAFAEDSSDLRIAPELAASWGSFEIWINGANLCAHIEEGEIVEAVHWYLLPLLEWLAANWNALLHEERLPVRNAGRDAVQSLYGTRFPALGSSLDRARADEQEWYDWRQRHAIHAARDGGLFPEVFLRRWEDQIEASWSNQSPPGSPEGFAFLVPYGRLLLDPDEVAQPLFGVMRAAAEQLRSWEPQSATINELRARIAELNKPAKQRQARLDWLFSLHPADNDAGSSWETVRSLFRGTSAKVRKAVLEPGAGSGVVLRGSSHAVLLFGSVDPTIDRADARRLARYLIDLFDETGDPPGLSTIVDEVMTYELDGLPWEQGYELAEQVSDLLRPMAVRSPCIVDALADLDVRVDTITLADDRIRGVTVAGPQHHPAILVNSSHPRNQGPEGRAFTLAHELCHLVVDRRIGRKLAVASGPWAPVEIEQRANAFAADFLMPSDEVRTVVAQLSSPLASFDGIRAIAKAFGTSPRATLEHMHNLGWIDEFQRDVLRGSSLGDESFGRIVTELGD